MRRTILACIGVISVIVASSHSALASPVSAPLVVSGDEVLATTVRLSEPLLETTSPQRSATIVLARTMNDWRLVIRRCEFVGPCQTYDGPADVSGYYHRWSVAAITEFGDVAFTMSSYDDLLGLPCGDGIAGAAYAMQGSMHRLVDTYGSLGDEEIRGRTCGDAVDDGSVYLVSR